MPEGMTFSAWVAAVNAKVAECISEKQKCEDLRAATKTALAAQDASQDQLSTKLAELQALLA